MPWRLIVFLLSLIVVLVFAGFNMNNSSNISFGFHELTDVPIFVSLLFSFILGVLFALPVAYFEKKNNKSKKKKPGIVDENIPETGETINKIDKKRFSFGAGLKKKDKKINDESDFEKKDTFI